MEVMAPTGGTSTLVASKRPPRPTSITATSTRVRRKISNAIAVGASTHVGAASADACATEDLEWDGGCGLKDRRWGGEPTVSLQLVGAVQYVLCALPQR